MFETAASHLDSEGDLYSPLLLRGNRIDRGQFGVELYPVIYPSSLVMLNPRWGADRYATYYANEYDQHYRLDLKPDVGRVGIIRNMEEIVGRLVHTGLLSGRLDLEVLDAGSGPGYGIPIVRDAFDCRRIDVVESSPDSLAVIEREEFAQVIGSDLTTAVQQSGKKYDLVIMRHIVEHLLSPVAEMSVVSESLKADGIVYISVPDMLNPRTVLRDYDDWWMYWFRAVHAYYYNKYTLQKTLCMANLEILELGCDNEEVWCVARRKTKTGSVYDYNYDAVFSEQCSVLARHLP